MASDDELMEELTAALADPDLVAEHRAALLIQMSQLALSMGSADEAVDGAREAVMLAPESELAWHALAVATSSARRWANLEVAMKKAASRFSDKAWPFQYLARAHLGADQAEDAVRAALAALRLDASASPSWELLAQAWWQIGDLSGAETAVHAIREHDGSDEVADRVELRVAVASGRRGDAVRLGGQLSQRYPDDPEVLLLHGTALLEASELAPATQVARRLVAIEPDSAAARVLRASVHAKAGEFRAAAREQRMALDRSEVASIPMWSALLSYELAAGIPLQAVVSAARALIEHPTCASLWTVLAHAKEQAGYPTHALLCAEVAGILHPDDESARATVARLRGVAPAGDGGAAAKLGSKLSQGVHAGQVQETLLDLLSTLVPVAELDRWGR